MNPIAGLYVGVTPCPVSRSCLSSSWVGRSAYVSRLWICVSSSMSEDIRVISCFWEVELLVDCFVFSTGSSLLKCWFEFSFVFCTSRLLIFVWLRYFKCSHLEEEVEGYSRDD